METKLKSSTLILAIHGSTEDNRPALAGQRLADTIRKHGLFREVKAAFHKHAPLLHETIDQADGNPVVIIPMLMSSGFFAEKIFPKALQLDAVPIDRFPKVTGYKGKTVVYAHPIGLHSGMKSLVIESAKTVLEQHPFPFKTPLSKTSIALIGHGTSQHTKSRGSADALAEELSSDPDICQGSRTFFIEENPAIKEIYQWNTPTRNVVVVPFMLADGPHAIQDIPIALGQPEREIEERLEKGNATWRNPTERNGKRIWISQPVGLSPLLPDLIIDYVRKEIPKVLID